MRVGNGGVENFKKRHLSSKACEENAKKNKKKKVQVGGRKGRLQAITSFFSKSQPTAAVTPTVVAPPPVHAPSISKTPVDASTPVALSTSTATPLPSAMARKRNLSSDEVHDHATNDLDAHGHEIDPTPSTDTSIEPIPPSSTKSPCSYALKLVSALRHIDQNLPDYIPEGVETDAMARFGDEWPVPDEPSEAWDCLDPFMNAVLGWGKTVEDLARDVRRGKMGMAGLLEIVEYFVTAYGIPGVLLEGKMARIFKAVEIA